MVLRQLTLRVEWDGEPIIFSASQFKLAGLRTSKDLGVFSHDVTRWQVGHGVETMAIQDGEGAPAIQFSLPRGKGVSPCTFTSIVCTRELTSILYIE